MFYNIPQPGPMIGPSIPVLYMYIPEATVGLTPGLGVHVYKLLG